MYYLEVLVSTFCLGKKEGLSVAKNLWAKIEEQKCMCKFSINFLYMCKCPAIFNPRTL